MSQTKIKPIAMYLPQYHPIPENDEWWGKGFTEWTNVTKAKPLFKDHYQPHLPADLGFYDLRLPETRQAQADMAREHGIFGFCYYHYWFNGKTLLEKPIEAMLKSGTPDFPFCMCWANENWSRNWDGKFKNILIEQKYCFDDDVEHIRALVPFFADPRYIRVHNKPVFIVYRTELFPDIKRTAAIWRAESIKSGIGDLYLIRVESFDRNVDPQSIGFDASFEFQPNWDIQPRRQYGNVFNRALDLVGVKTSVFSRNQVRLYKDFVDTQIQRAVKTAYKRYPGIMPMWDNTARRKTDAYVLHGSTPEEYGKWLKHIVHTFQPYSEEENFIFINAWNEWGEGNHLEPCQKWGTSYLEITRKVLNPELNQ
jgi:lipopolysaccharide biosynthesis protein